MIGTFHGSIKGLTVTYGTDDRVQPRENLARLERKAKSDQADLDQSQRDELKDDIDRALRMDAAHRVTLGSDWLY